MHIRPVFTAFVTIVVLASTGLLSAGASPADRSPTTQTLSAPGPAATQARAATAADACGYTKAIPADNFKGIPKFDAAKAAEPYKATLVTTQGSITFRALTTDAPCTTYSFRFLAERDYYDGTHCHRLVTQRIYVLQCGDPTGTGSGGPGYSFNDENLEGATYPAGTVAMANAGPNTNGSQFFLVTEDTQLSPNYTPFGVVTHGMSVLRRIARAGDDSQNGPGDGYPNKFVEFRDVVIDA